MLCFDKEFLYMSPIDIFNINQYLLLHGGITMKNTKKQLRKLGNVLGQDLKNAAQKAKEGAGQAAGKVADASLETIAGAVGFVKKEGGLGQLGLKLLKGAAGTVGKAAGYAARASVAVYETAVHHSDIKSSRKSSNHDDGDEERNLGERVSTLFSTLRTEFSQHYQGSDIKPEKVGELFERATRRAAEGGAGAVHVLYKKISEGKDVLSRKFQEYVPTDTDYTVRVGARDVSISRDILTKPEIEKVKSYMATLAGALPKGYRDKTKLLASVATAGIRSDKEFMKKQLTLYEKVRKYLSQ